MTDNNTFISLINESFDKLKDYHSKERKNINIQKLTTKNFVRWTLTKGITRICGKDMLFKEVYKYISGESRRWQSLETVYNVLFKNDKLRFVYEMLENDDSKRIFEWFIKVRICYLMVGEYAIKVFPANSAYKNWIHNQKNEIKMKRSGLLHKVESYKIKRTYALDTVWLGQKYSLSDYYTPELGDVVIDAGAFYGESSVWFAHKVGNKGSVYAFEPLFKCFRELVRCIKRNNLQQIVFPIAKGVWECEKEIGFIQHFKKSHGSGYICEESKKKICVTTIDEFVQHNKLKKVDMIKMNICGAEQQALKGSMQTIKKFKPNLAICISNKVDDIEKIPIFIKELNQDYKFYLSHINFYDVETILFCISNRGKPIYE